MLSPVPGGLPLPGHTWLAPSDVSASSLSRPIVPPNLENRVPLRQGAWLAFVILYSLLFWFEPCPVLAPLPDSLLSSLTAGSPSAAATYPQDRALCVTLRRHPINT